MHAPDEDIPLANIVAAARIYAATAEKLAAMESTHERRSPALEIDG